MQNMEMWNSLSKPPEWALKKIMAGRLKGKSDINPQWRYEAMTKQFGPCGFGWKYTIDKLWIEQAAHGSVMAFALVTLYVKSENDWSEGIPGIGGNQMVQVESAGLHSNDECYKMAITDALSVACKLIGVGADVYKGLSDSKYDKAPQGSKGEQPTDNELPWLNKTMPEFKQAKAAIEQGVRKLTDITKKYKLSKENFAYFKGLKIVGVPATKEPTIELEPYYDDDLPF